MHYNTSDGIPELKIDCFIMTLIIQAVSLSHAYKSSPCIILGIYSMLYNPLTLTHSMLTLEVSNVSAIIRQLHQHNLLLYNLFLQSKFIDDKCYFCHYVNKISNIVAGYTWQSIWCS